MTMQERMTRVYGHREADRCPIVDSPGKHMDLSIREAHIGDYEELCEIFMEVDTLHGEALPHLFRAPNGPVRTKEYISGVIGDENAALFVAQSEGEIVGLVQVFVRDAPDLPIMVPRRWAAIDTLVVKRGFRRSGIGRALMERAHGWAQNKGATQVELTVWEFNGEAIAFYQELGYQTGSRRMCRALSADD